MSSNEMQELIRTGANVVSACASVVSACAIVIALRQLALQRQVWKTMHERSRAEKSIEVIRAFNSTFTAQSAATSRLVELLDPTELKALDDGRPFQISSSHENDVRAALPGKTLNLNGGQIFLTSEQVYEIRYQALEVLNAVEIVCQAWKLDVADQSAIESEIENLYDPSLPEPTTLLRKYRNVFHGERFYPALYAFTHHLDEKRRSTMERPRTLVPRPNDQ